MGLRWGTVILLRCRIRWALAWDHCAPAGPWAGPLLWAEVNPKKMRQGLAPEPQNGSIFENRVTAEINSYDEVESEQNGPSAQGLVSLEEEGDLQTLTGVGPREGPRGEGGRARATQSLPGKDLPPETPRAQHHHSVRPDSGLQAERVSVESRPRRGGRGSGGEDPHPSHQ